MACDTLSDSEAMIAKIVAFLAEKGVRLTDVSAVELGYPREQGADTLFENAIEWLISENIIRQRALHRTQGGKLHETVAKSCVLTSHGFALLAVPFDKNLSLGAAVRQTAEEGSGFSNAGSFFGGLLGSFTKSVAN
ncbi:hypothetical protein ROLI_017070 [Roseobacter fucihabitans]|uniref:Uncharacterized protein n=1 Tax=Roseobacter fucihabitans TaxID=1537242 RepID=A0ABZ2BTH9_9RHOB|nr:hypothetical protein [Roseobacter litoralis]MBC6964418.1 hypothetical protein [Roseobacter litoralis]